MRLPPALAASGYRLIVHDCTGSTSDDAAAAARRGEPGRLWIMAAEQRAGRGRHGRSWTSPRGNLYASLMLRDPCEPARAPELGFLAGLAVHETVAAATGLCVPRLALKWPNDLILDGAKVAGILLDGQVGGAGALAVVIGFGVNLAVAPDDTPYPATALSMVEPGLTAPDVFAGLALAFDRRLAVWGDAREAEPFASVRRQWLARAAGLGEPVTIRLPGGARSGVFRGLDRAGRLELETGAGVELLDAGDVFFPREAAVQPTPGAPG